MEYNKQIERDNSGPALFIHLLKSKIIYEIPVFNGYFVNHKFMANHHKE
jgi:hypothetical protein